MNLEIVKKNIEEQSFMQGNNFENETIVKKRIDFKNTKSNFKKFLNASILLCAVNDDPIKSLSCI